MNKRGLSTIVTTLLIILLVLVATGIVWGVVSGILKGGALEAGSSTRCLYIGVEATAINCNDPEACVVVLKRTGSDTDAIGGVKFVFEDSTNEERSASAIDVEGNIERLVGRTTTQDSGVTAPDKLEITVYLEDEFGKEEPCSTVEFSVGGGISGDGNGNGNGNGGDPPGGGEDTFCGDLIVQTLNDAGTGGPSNNGTEECDGGLNCGEIDAPYPCSCPSGYISDGSNGCEVDDSISCDGIFEPGEQCDGGLGCIDCLCGEGYIPTVPPSADCLQITYINSGTIDNVWPPGTGIYFDDDALPMVDALYYGKAAFFPGVDPTQCFLIIGYDYDANIYVYSAIVELDLFSPLNIALGDDYQIWDEMQECTAALA